jgi:exonuclease SbcD
MIGGLDQISADVFGVFDYVALGHLHQPQRLTRDTLRYAGSPLKYSFSEVTHKKSVTIIEMKEKGNVAVKTVPLTPVRDMRLIEGKLEEILALPPSEDYVWVTVTDEIVPPDAKLDIAMVFPNMMKFSIVNSRTKTDMDVLSTQEMETKDVMQLFRDFYRLQNNDQEPTDAHMDVLGAVIKRLEEKRDETR